jgi:hypothetical protein
MKNFFNPFQRVFAMSLGIHSKVGWATHEQFANSIAQLGEQEFRSPQDWGLGADRELEMITQWFQLEQR